MSALWPERDDPPDGASWLDAELRGATPPADLVARLQAIPVADDADFDGLLRDVPAPAGLVGRLCQLGVQLADDRKHRARVEQRAVAATLAAASWCAYAAALILCWAANYQPALESGEIWLQSASPVENGASLVESELVAGEMSSIHGNIPHNYESQDGASPFAWRAISENAAASKRKAEGRESSGLHEPPPEQLLAFNWPSPFAPRFDFSVLLDAPAVAAQPVSAAAVPPSAGFDRDFFARTGVLPRIDPKSQPWSRPPLATEGDCFEFVRECLAAGRLPPAAEIRTEQLLAAADYVFDRPRTGALALAARGARAAWPRQLPSGTRDRSLRLLQLAVAAKDPAGQTPGAAPRSASDEIVAEHVRLAVRFNPQAVKSYRLCGHEPTHLEGPPVAPACDLSAGQATTVVYELELYEAGEGNFADTEIAAVSLEWRDAASGLPRSLTRAVRSRQIAAPIGDADENVQLAALAVAAAEVLRRSPFAEAMSPAELLAMARAAKAGAERPQAFVPWIDLFEQILAVEKPRERASHESPTPFKEPAP